MLGHGDAFVLRDPNGIRPGYYFCNDEFVVVTSERPVIQTAFNINQKDIKEINPGGAVIIKKNGDVKIEQILEQKEKKSCSFERIYFSRGNDHEIYKERKKLGAFLVAPILKSIENNLEDTVFSYIPNTAETAFYGLLTGLENHLNNTKTQLLNSNKIDELKQIIDKKIRVEKMAVKDAKLRTFITADTDRDGLVGHVYDVTYGAAKPKDTLVILDDSIVRGTTLKRSILRILDRLDLKKIIVVSSAPQIRYPDCYGIDMAKLGDFIAFRAVMSLLNKSDNGKSLIDSTYIKCKTAIEAGTAKNKNYLIDLYAPFQDSEISNEISKLLKTDNINTDFEIIFQTVDKLHKSCPNHLGDWYFTGNYPTEGGNLVANKSFMYYVEGNKSRAY